jgi:hypothetical protein
MKLRKISSTPATEFNATLRHSPQTMAARQEK